MSIVSNKKRQRPATPTPENETSARPRPAALAAKTPPPDGSRHPHPGPGAAGRPAADDHRPYAADGLFCPPGGHAGRNDHLPLRIDRLVFAGFRFRHRDSRRPRRNGPGGRQPDLRPFALEAPLQSSNVGTLRIEKPRLSAKLTRDGSNVQVAARPLADRHRAVRPSQGVDLSVEVVDGEATIVDQETQQSWHVSDLQFALGNVADLGHIDLGDRGLER